MWHRDITGEMFTVRLLCIVVLSELTIVFCVLTNNKCPLLNLLWSVSIGTRSQNGFGNVKTPHSQKPLGHPVARAGQMRGEEPHAPSWI